MGLNSIPRSLDIKNLHKWSQAELQTLQTLELTWRIENVHWIKSKKNANGNSSSILRNAAGGSNIHSGHELSLAQILLSTQSQQEVKRIYVEEGAALLKNKIDLPPRFDEK